MLLEQLMQKSKAQRACLQSWLT